VEFHEVAVDQDHGSDPGPDKVVCHATAKSPETDDDGPALL
jgi:hypothetical protein